MARVAGGLVPNLPPDILVLLAVLPSSTIDYYFLSLAPM